MEGFTPKNHKHESKDDSKTVRAWLCGVLVFIGVVAIVLSMVFSEGGQTVQPVTTPTPTVYYVTADALLGQLEADLDELTIVSHVTGDDGAHIYVMLANEYSFTVKVIDNASTVSRVVFAAEYPFDDLFECDTQASQQLREQAVEQYYAARDEILRVLSPIIHSFNGYAVTDKQYAALTEAIDGYVFGSETEIVFEQSSKTTITFSGNKSEDSLICTFNTVK